MQDPVTGAFKPQENDYLNTVPGPALLGAFEAAIRPMLEKANRHMPAALYLQAQRWGSALPAPVGVGGRDAHGYSAETTVEVLSVRYECSMPPLLQRTAPLPADAAEAEGAANGEADFVALDADTRVFYAGDFCSRRPPGFEAAALSGLGVAAHIRRALCE